MTTRLVSLLTFLLVASIGLADEELPMPKQKVGLQLGAKVPISSMKIIVGQHNGRNSCLAGKNREHKTISLYSRLADDELFIVVAKMEEWLKANDTWRGYVLVFEKDAKAAANIQKLAKQHKIERVEIATSNADESYFVEKYALPPRAEFLMVYSDKLDVKFRDAFNACKLEGKFLEEMGKVIAGKAK